MLEWLVERSLLVYVILAVLGVGFFLLWRQKGERKHVYAMAGVVGAGFLLWILSLFVTTDRQRLRQTVEDMADAVVKGESARLLKHFAREFSYDGVDRKTVAELAAKRHGVQHVHLYKFRYEHLSRSEGKAKVRFGARIDLAREQHLIDCVADFVWRDERWQLLAVNFFNPLVNQDQPLKVPLR